MNWNNQKGGDVPYFLFWFLVLFFKYDVFELVRVDEGVGESEFEFEFEFGSRSLDSMGESEFEG